MIYGLDAEGTWDVEFEEQYSVVSRWTDGWIGHNPVYLDVQSICIYADWTSYERSRVNESASVA